MDLICAETPRAGGLRSPKPGVGGSSPSTPASPPANYLISLRCDKVGLSGATIEDSCSVHLANNGIA
jgi:hypothetical protein